MENFDIGSLVLFDWNRFEDDIKAYYKDAAYANKLGFFYSIGLNKRISRAGYPKLIGIVVENNLINVHYADVYFFQLNCRERVFRKFLKAA